MKNIFVIGSVNTDITLTVSRLPQLGESVRGNGILTAQGGKGANQAIACAKLGGERVHFVGAVGTDERGDALLKSVSDYGVLTEGCVRVHGAESGICVILFDEGANDNMLVVEEGANALLSPDIAEAYLKKNAKEGDILLVQLEISSAAVQAALKTGKRLGLYTILNPAPARAVEEEIFKNVDLLIPNETEFRAFTGIEANNSENILRGYQILKKKGVEALIVTRGRYGSTYVGEEQFDVAAVPVKAVDTTAAGDTFIGALSVCLAKGSGMKEAMLFASRCASVTVSRKGASQSIPYRDEIIG